MTATVEGHGADPSDLRWSAGLRLVCGALAALAAAVSVVGVLALPWSDGDDRVLDLVTYPGQVAGLFVVPVAMAVLAVGAWRRWHAVGVAAALVCAPSLFWVQPMTVLWDLRDEPLSGSGFVAQGWAGLLGLAAVALGALAVALDRPRAALGATRPSAAEGASALVGAAAFVASLMLDRYALTVGGSTSHAGAFFADGWTDQPPRFVALRVAAVVAVAVAVAGTILRRSSAGARGRLLVWAGLAAGLGLDLVVRATSTGDLQAAPAGVDPPQIEPTTAGLLAVVVGAVAFLVAGRLAGRSEAAPQTGERA